MKPGRYTRAAAAEQLAAPPLAPVILEEAEQRETLPPPPPSLPPAQPIKVVKFVDHGRTGGDIRPVRELSYAQASFSEGPRGVLIDGRILVPWSNIRWIEYR